MYAVWLLFLLVAFVPVMGRESVTLTTWGQNKPTVHVWWMEWLGLFWVFWWRFTVTLIWRWLVWNLCGGRSFWLNCCWCWNFCTRLLIVSSLISQMMLKLCSFNLLSWCSWWLSLCLCLCLCLCLSLCLSLSLSLSLSNCFFVLLFFSSTTHN